MSLLIRPIITEKSLRLAGARQYTFAVDQRASKVAVASDVSRLYKVKVEAVNLLNVIGQTRRFKGHLGRTKNWKKAIVTLAKGGKIPGFELETTDESQKTKSPKA